MTQAVQHLPREVPGPEFKLKIEKIRK
jgi:hypothetical protein